MQNTKLISNLELRLTEIKFLLMILLTDDVALHPAPTDSYKSILAVTKKFS